MRTLRVAINSYISADGFSTQILDDEEGDIYFADYHYGRHVSYNKENAERGKPYVSDLLKNLVSDYHVDEIQVVGGKYHFSNELVSEKDINSFVSKHILTDPKLSEMFGPAYDYKLTIIEQDWKKFVEEENWQKDNDKAITYREEIYFSGPNAMQKAAIKVRDDMFSRRYEYERVNGEKTTDVTVGETASLDFGMKFDSNGDTKDGRTITYKVTDAHDNIVDMDWKRVLSNRAYKMYASKMDARLNDADFLPKDDDQFGHSGPSGYSV